MRPKWFGYSQVPYDDMWPDDKLWYPMMFNNKYFDGHFKFEGMSNILEHSITERASGNWLFYDAHHVIVTLKYTNHFRIYSTGSQK